MNILEIKVEQKKRLYTLLEIKNSVDITIPKLEEAIDRTIAEMEKEDVAYIEKIIYKK